VKVLLKLSIFALMWVSLVSGSIQLNMDVKLVSNGSPVHCVCNHGNQACLSVYYSFTLALEHNRYADKSLQSIIEANVENLIHKFQRVGVLNFRSNLQCSSLRLIRKDSARDDVNMCARLWQAPFAEVLNQLEMLKDLALEINLVEVKYREYLCDGGECQRR
jgi:hypothetical protein